MPPEQPVDPNLFSGEIDDIEPQEEMSEPEGLVSDDLQQFLPPPQPFDFHENIAEHLSEEELDELATQLIEDIDTDKEARSEWENTINIAFKFLGFKIQEYQPDPPFKGASGAYDTSLAQALITAYSVFRAELLPAEGPAAMKILGVQTKDKQDRAERTELYTNYYLTKADKSYYPDFEQLFMFNILCSTFSVVALLRKSIQIQSLKILSQDLLNHRTL